MSRARAHHIGDYAVVTASVAHCMSVGQALGLQLFPYCPIPRYLEKWVV